MVGPVRGPRKYPLPTINDIKPIRKITAPPPVKLALSPAAQAYLEALKRPKPKAPPPGPATVRKK